MTDKLDLSDLPNPHRGKIDVAISGCLTGQTVRYDGGHKHSSLPHAQLDHIYNYRPFCPEIGIGLGTPREPISLVGPRNGTQAIGVNGNVTEQLTQFAEDTLDSLRDLSGYILMKDSPSCGLYRVKRYENSNERVGTRDSQGIYARHIAQLMPLLPMEDSGRLFDPVLRENFATRTYVYTHWKDLLNSGITAKKLIAFHSLHKFLVMASSPVKYRELGNLLANLKHDLHEISETYIRILMTALAIPATRGGHANVLTHLYGYVKKSLPSHVRHELITSIENFRTGLIPLLAPLTLLNHHLKTHGVRYAQYQIYLDPHPAWSGLRRAI